jgi:chromatin remodeling complex protein RSC6
VAQFTGWSSAEPRARVEVTNFVCDYIKRNNLQSPTDRRVINADSDLSKLLDYQAERDGNLTYATIQKLLAKHYTPVASSA